MESFFNMESFLNFAFAVTLLMAGNAASGAMKAKKAGNFDKQQLIDGIINYALWLVTILCLVAATEIYGGDFNITIGDSTYTLSQAVEIAKRTVYVIWAGKLIQNVYEYAGISKQVNLDRMLEERAAQNSAHEESGGLA